MCPNNARILHDHCPKNIFHAPSPTSTRHIKCVHLLISGQKDVLKKRLKSYFKRKYISRPGIAGQKQPLYSYYIVIDFEATCDENSHNYPHEIIEFPAVLVNATDGSVVGILLFSFS